MNATEIMTIDPKTVRPEDPLEVAVRALEEGVVRHLPVVNDAGELVGMISDRDLRSLLYPYAHTREERDAVLARAGARVASIMSSDVVCVELEDDVSAAAERMLEHKVGAVPVVDADGVLVGIISYVDLIRHYLISESSEPT